MIYLLIAFGVFLVAVGIALIPDIKKEWNETKKIKIMGSGNFSDNFNGIKAVLIIAGIVVIGFVIWLILK